MGMAGCVRSCFPVSILVRKCLNVSVKIRRFHTKIVNNAANKSMKIRLDVNRFFKINQEVNNEGTASGTPHLHWLYFTLAIKPHHILHWRHTANWWHVQGMHLNHEFAHRHPLVHVNTQCLWLQACQGKIQEDYSRHHINSSKRAQCMHAQTTDHVHS